MALLVLAPATVHAQNVNLAWDPSLAPEVTGYTVNVGLNPNAPGQTFDVGQATTFTFTQAIPGTRYYFSVRAYDAENNWSAPSNEVSWKINVGPRLTEPAQVASRVGVAASLQLAAIDDGDPLTYSATGLPTGLTINPSTGRITGTPTSVGSRFVNVTVSDGEFTATHAFSWDVAAPPSADSVTPATGSGTSQTFQFAYTDPLGVTATTQLWAWFNTNLTVAANSCLTYYDIPSARLNLINDAGTAWLQGTLGSSGTLQNSACAVSLAGSSVSLSGNAALLTLPIAFRSGLGGAKNVYTFAAAGSVNSGWQTRGSWTVPGLAVGADSVSPASGTGSSGQFSFEYSDTFGATDLATAWVWFHTTTSTAANSCLIYYDRTAHRLHLVNNAASVWQSGPIGGSGTLQNSQCSIALGNSSVSLNGTALTLNLAVTFNPSFAGAKNIYMFAASVGGRNTGWQTRGNWTVPGTSLAVNADSVAPAMGTGSTQTFSMQYSDTAGATDLATTWVWFHTTTSTAVNSCLLYYDRAAARLHLVNDAATIWQSARLGSTGTLQNSQCAVALGGSSIVLSGTALTLNLAITFNGSFAGAKNIYMYAASVGGRNTGWQARGSWTVPGVTLAVSADTVSPATGSGSSQGFAFQYSDTLGATDLATTWVWFHTTTSTAVNSCLLYYDRPAARLHLVNDAATAWLSGTFGSGGTLQNSQCAIALGSSSVSMNGTTLTLNLALTFRGTFAGTKNIYMYAASVGGRNTGWQARGTWTVPPPASPVTADSATPNTGTGRAPTFVLRYSDSTGGANLRNLWFWAHTTTSSAASSCLIYISRQWNEVYLINDAGTGWIRGTIPFGSMSNRSCNLNLGATSVTVSGNTVTVSLPVAFTTNFLGTKNIYMFADNGSGANSGWQTRGSWTVQ